MKVAHRGHHSQGLVARQEANKTGRSKNCTYPRNKLHGPFTRRVCTEKLVGGWGGGGTPVWFCFYFVSGFSRTNSIYIYEKSSLGHRCLKTGQLYSLDKSLSHRCQGIPFDTLV